MGQTGWGHCPYPLLQMWRCLHDQHGTEMPDGGHRRSVPQKQVPFCFFHSIGVINVLFTIVWELIFVVIPGDVHTGSQ